jgi:UDP-2-acetamido-3-amino-2,3-dideoxy-glucuronate N-acetyltransferase
MIHRLADVQSEKIGLGTKVWQFSTILQGAKIGSNCNINCHVFIENDVIIGDNVTVKSGVYLWDGIEIEDDVFIGPNVTFTNDQRPRSKQYPTAFQKTCLKRCCSIGAAAIVLGGVTVGAYSMIAAGSLVTRDVPDRAQVMGCPAKIVGWINENGTKMRQHADHFIDDKGDKWVINDNNLVKL